MLPRHVSIADTVIPMVFYAIPKQVRLRYVLKRELLFDPCLDIVGNRLPNCFVARSGADAQARPRPGRPHSRATSAANEGFLIYPEGTRFSAERRRRVLEGLASRVGAADLERMHAWSELLPPRPGGATTLIRAAPDLDLVFCAHTGFEGASHVRHLINGSWIGADIRIRFWRVDHRDIPADEAAQRAFLFTQWDRMQETVVALQQRTCSSGNRRMDKTAFYRNARTDLTGPLQGITVLEATTTWAGPMAGCMLADFGADVIKVEHPTGEVARRLRPLIPDSPASLSLPHETVNRNKRSVTVNLSSSAGRDVFLDLARRADIVVENFRPGTMAEWGVGYEDVRAVKPDIVYVSISGFGQFGTLSHRVGYDPVAQHFSGFTSLNGDPDGRPVKAATFLGDDLAGIHAALGALAALRHRDRTGEGQHVDVALVDGLLFQSNGNIAAGALGIEMPRMGNEFTVCAPTNTYDCLDGQVFAGVLLDAHWRRLAAIIGRPEFADDPRYATINARLGRRAEVERMLADWCATCRVADVVAAFEDERIARGARQHLRGSRNRAARPRSRHAAADDAARRHRGAAGRSHRQIFAHANPRAQRSGTVGVVDRNGVEAAGLRRAVIAQLRREGAI